MPETAFSLVVACTAVASGLAGYRAMQRGLDRVMIRAGATLLLVFAIGRTWHALFEAFGFGEGELLEYLMYFAGYIAFIAVCTRAEPPGKRSA